MKSSLMNAKVFVGYKTDFDRACVRPGPQFKCFICGEWADNMIYQLHKKWHPESDLDHDRNFLCGAECSLRAHEKYKDCIVI